MVPFEDAVYDRVGNILMSRAMDAEVESAAEGFDIVIGETWRLARRFINMAARAVRRTHC